LKKNAGDFAYAVLLLLVNVFIASRLFRLNYSGYLGSIEGTFIAIAKQVAAHPSDLLWWPYWDCGLPFQNTYLPLLQLVVAAYSRIMGSSPSLAFHQICAALFCLAPVSVFAMARGITGKIQTSFLVALAFSLFSPCAWLVPAIRNDLGSLHHLRRLQILVYYGEGPHTACLALLPLAVLFLYLSLVGECLRYRILAGALVALAVLANAFGAAILAVVVLCLLVTIRTGRIWRNALLLGAICLLAYVWISPLVPPSVLSAIRANSPTVGGDYRFTLRSLSGVIAIVVGGAGVRHLTRRLEDYLRFFLLYAWSLSSIVLLGTLFAVYVVPQPHRYQIAMDLGLCLAIGFSLAKVAAARRVVAAVFLIACIFQFVHDRRYAHSLIRAIDPTHTVPYRIAAWVDKNMSGQRVMISGAYALQFNIFTDTPQLEGGHVPMLPNFLLRIATYAIYSGMNAGAQDAEISTLWLQAFGAHAVSVPGASSAENYQPFVNPHKFEGVLPVLWREGDDTIYGVPARSSSLAHVVPEQSLVREMPKHGMDILELRQFVAGLSDPAMPDAPLIWRDRHTAEIRVQPMPRTALSVQITHHRGWKAWSGGHEVPVGRDGLGFMVMRPQCSAPCTVTLEYDGGPELRWTVLASAVLMIGVAAVAVRKILGA
jgi:hypothetical protein